MKAIDILMDEHQVILKVLDALEVYAQGIQKNNGTDYKDFARFAEFFREFADKCHHGKEEAILFEEMINHGISRERGPLAVMYYDHDLGRTQVRIMAEIGSTPQFDETARQKAVQSAFTYITMLRSHIFKEDRILYPMALQSIPTQVMEDMAEKFEEFEEKETGAGVHHYLHKLGEELIEKYGK